MEWVRWFLMWRIIHDANRHKELPMARKLTVPKSRFSSMASLDRYDLAEIIRFVSHFVLRYASRGLRDHKSRLGTELYLFIGF